MQVASVPPSAVALQNAVAGRKAGEPTAEKAEAVTEQVRYLSPRIQLDRDAGAVVIQYRDSDTGEVKEQFPPGAAAESYRQRSSSSDSSTQGQTVSSGDQADQGDVAKTPRAPVKVSATA